MTQPWIGDIMPAALRRVLGFLVGVGVPGVPGAEGELLPWTTVVEGPLGALGAVAPQLPVLQALTQVGVVGLHLFMHACWSAVHVKYGMVCVYSNIIKRNG